MDIRLREKFWLVSLEKGNLDAGVQFRAGRQGDETAFYMADI